MYRKRENETMVIRGGVVEGLVTIRGFLPRTIGKQRRILSRKVQGSDVYFGKINFTTVCRKDYRETRLEIGRCIGRRLEQTR